MKRLKLAMALCMTTLLGALALPAPALAAGGNLGGSGTAEDPYRIEDADDMFAFAEKVNGGETYACAVLENDIDLGGSSRPWTPIGYSPNFRGVFDGSRHVVSGLYINGNSGQVGLFGVMAGTVKDLTVVGEVNGANWVGGIAGRCGSSGDHGGIIERCTSQVAVSGDMSVGGICGALSLGAVSGCSNLGTVTGEYQVGGIAGELLQTPVTVSDCYNEGDIVATEFFAGGICGYAMGGTVISNCCNTGSITESLPIVGEIAGRANNATIQNCCYLDEDGTTPDTTEGVFAIDQGSFEGGVAAWLLQAGREDTVWGQELYTATPDTRPILTSDSSLRVSQLAFSSEDGTIAGAIYANPGTAFDVAPILPPAPDGQHVSLECAVEGVCPQDDTVVVPAFDATVTYSYEDHVLAYENDETTHWQACTGCNYATEPVSHAGGTATCASGAICETCGGAYGATDPTNHAALTHVPATEPTEAKPGNIEHWACSGCGKLFSNAAATTELTPEQVVVAWEPSEPTPAEPSEPNKTASVTKRSGRGIPATGDATAALPALAALAGAALACAGAVVRARR